MLGIKNHLERISTTQEDSANSMKMPSHRRALNANSNQIMKTDCVVHLHGKTKKTKQYQKGSYSLKRGEKGSRGEVGREGKKGPGEREETLIVYSEAWSVG